MVKKLDKVNALIKYIRYKLKAKHRKGHGIHSPAVFKFVSEVLFNGAQPPKKLFDIIGSLNKSAKSLVYTEYGAGSAKMNNGKRRIKDIARYTGICPKYGKLLYRIAKYYKQKTVVELGTSIGISTMYLAAGLENQGKLISVEGNKELSAIAGKNLLSLGLKNTELIVSTFEGAIPELLAKVEPHALIFIDGNHTYDATVKYFESFLPRVQKGMFIIGDIYWSVGMEMAWKRIKEMSTVTIDLYYMGIVYIDEMLTPGHYLVRY